MSLLAFSTSTFSQQIAAMLLHFVWQGFAIALVVGAILKFRPCREANSRYLVSVAALVAMIAAPFITWLWLQNAELPRLVSPRGAEVTSEHVPAFVSQGLFQSVMQFTASTSWSQAARQAAGNYASWIVFIWAAGVMVFSFRLLAGLVSAWGLRRSRQPMPAQWIERLTALGERLHVNIERRVFVSLQVSEAIATGFFRPLVILPVAWLAELPPGMVEAVVAHELAHIRRWDLWINLLQRVVETLLFYHPAVWWLSNVIRSEREMCCDEMAVAATCDRVGYARTLEFLARSIFAARPVLNTGIGDKKMKLLNRVRYVLNPSSARRQSACWPAGIASLMALTTLGIALVAMRQNAIAEEPAPATEAPKPAAKTPAETTPARGSDPGPQRPAVAPAEPGRERAPAAGGERKPDPRGGVPREFIFPNEITLSAEQQTKLNELQAIAGAKLTELLTKREAILTDAQKAARREVDQQARAGNFGRAEYAEKMSTALALTPEQQTQVTAVEEEFKQFRQSVEQQKMAILTAEQRETLRKLAVAQNTSRVFAFPSDVLLSEQQTASLKALETELGPKFTDLSQRQGALLTEERRVARDAAAKAASEAGLGRAETAEAIRAALNFTEAEVAQLAEIETSMRELRTQIQDRKLGILTPEQRQQFEARLGSGRGR